MSSVQTEVNVITGVAGCGKTTHLLNLIDAELEAGNDLLEIGYVSYTQAAANEALTRACDRFADRGYALEAMRSSSWFRTIHSACFRQLGLARSLVVEHDSSAGRRWFAENLDVQWTDADQEPGTGMTLDDQRLAALVLWERARSQMISLREAFELEQRTAWIMPDWEIVVPTIEKYERAKRLDNRFDFHDMLARYAGVAYHADGEPYDTKPEGLDVYGVTSWYVDEAQDNSTIMHKAMMRLTSHGDRVTLVGDPQQSIYTFAGSDPFLFQSLKLPSLPLGGQNTLHHSFRCPSIMIERGEQILAGVSDYWPRGATGTDTHGVIDEYEVPLKRIPFESLPQHDDDVLILCRTNRNCGLIGRELDERAIPWLPVGRWNNRWKATEQIGNLFAFRALEAGQPISSQEWRRILGKSDLRVKDGKSILLEHGTKAAWVTRECSATEMVDLEGLTAWGATAELVERIKAGRWLQWVRHAENYNEAIERWGYEAVQSPRIRVSTIHAAKGAEADTVLVYTQAGKIIEKAMEFDDLRDAELRLAYVAVTRARKHLIIVHEPMEFRIPV